MRIGFDARMITHPGIGRYIEGLLPEVVKQSPNDEFVIFGPLKALKKICTGKNVQLVKWGAPIYSFQEQLFYPYDKFLLDVIHIPHFNIPISCKAKIIATIHDLIYLLFPASSGSFLARRYVRFMIGQCLKKSCNVISVSKSTKNDIISIFGPAYSEKIKVIHEASINKFRRVNDNTSMNTLKNKYKLSDKVILYVGSVKPHKNVKTLIEVYKNLEKKGLPHQLIVTGRWDNKENYLLNCFNENKIRYIGEIPTDHLILLYNYADILLHLSLYEGFGLTLLEAMQCGTPVIASNSSSIPEICNDAAFLVNPLDIGQITDTVYNVLDNNSIKRELVERGIKRAGQFSWEKAAYHTLETYKNA